MIKTAIIGFGMSGKTIHFPLLQAHSGFELRHVVSRNEHTASYLREKGSDASVVRDFQTILDDPSVDLVVLTVPNHLHQEYVESAIGAGKHVVVEKPFVEHHEDAKRLFDLARKKGTVLRVFHNRRYDGDFMTVRELIENDTLGDIISLSARFDRFRAKPKDGWRMKDGAMSGVFYDLGPHLFHYAITLFGPPKSLYCERITDHPGLKTDDHFEAVLSYQDFRVTLGAEQFARHPLPKFHVKGLEGSYVKYGFDTPEFVEMPFGNDYQSGLYSKRFGNDALEAKDIPVKTGAHHRWYDDLKRDITDLTLMNRDVEISLEVIRAMEAAVKSDETGRRITL